MTSFNYAATAATASRLLERFGAVATLKRVTQGAYNASTGAATASDTEIATVAVVFDYHQKYIDGTLIMAGDKQAYMDPGVAPLQGDKLAWQGVTYTIVAVKPLAPAGTVVLHEAQLRA